MAVVRYKPGVVLEWLEGGSARMRTESSRMAQSVLKREGHRSVKRDLREVAGALFQAGTASMADLALKQIEKAEYVLDETSLSIVTLTSSRKIQFSEIKAMELESDTCTLVLERGSVKIKPFAHIVVGRVSVPAGWLRNGVEVDYSLLLEEISAHCGLEIVSR